MVEKPDNEMDKVLRANRARAESRLELVENDGTHIAYVAPVEPGANSDILTWKGGLFLRVPGLALVYRETIPASVTEVA